MRRLALAAVAPLLVTACAAGASGGTHAGTVSTIRTAKNVTHLKTWATYNRDNSRSGVANATINAPLQNTWTKQLTGGVYGQVLVVHGWLIVATENNDVYQIDPGSGAIRWRTHLGKPESETNLRNDQPGCGDIFPLGITGTPAYDAKTGSVFVVAETQGGHHTLWALNASTGKRQWSQSTDLLKNRDRKMEQQRPALLVSGGRVFTAYGAVSGDCGDYGGYITSTATTGKGKTNHYAVPTRRGAGMWSAAGPVLGQNGNIYVISANSVDHAGVWDKSDSVTELTPTRLKRVAAFAPTAWKTDNQHDNGLGSMGPVPVAGRILIAGKRGPVYLLKTSLGGIGAQIQTLHGCQAYGGAAHQGHIVLLPCHSGVRELIVHKNHMHWGWKIAGGAYGSPIIAGNHVIVPHDPTGGFPGLVTVYSLATGASLGTATTDSTPHFPSATVVANHIFVGGVHGLSAVRGS